MNELHDEIRQTMLALNQENAHPVVEELQCHLANLFDMVRNELQQRLKESSWLFDIAMQPEAPYKSVKLDGKIDDGAKPLTVEELKAGGWRLNSCKKDDWLSFGSYGVAVFSDKESWLDDDDYCFLNKNSGEVERDYRVSATPHLKQIHRINNDFFWSEK